jgi:hypothetical protein
MHQSQLRRVRTSSTSATDPTVSITGLRRRNCTPHWMPSLGSTSTRGRIRYQKTSTDSRFRGDRQAT